jgi:hypothetical protein
LLLPGFSAVFARLLLPGCNVFRFVTRLLHGLCHAASKPCWAEKIDSTHPAEGDLYDTMIRV